TAQVALKDIFVDTEGGSRTAPTRSVCFVSGKFRINPGTNKILSFLSHWHIISSAHYFPFFFVY
ncbi:hypothetical protein, partial [Parabacteroides sp. AF48-14]|uniref:hypothetical protein n=1 Tax=Parabacteroides sp. AF48-14 TaxID=2292052 RepID=UPI001F32C35C